MTIRILPGAFGLELCLVNRFQATDEMNQHHWFYTDVINMSDYHRLGFLGLGFRVLLVSLEPASARAIMAFQQGLCLDVP